MKIRRWFVALTVGAACCVAVVFAWMLLRSESPNVIVWSAPFEGVILAAAAGQSVAVPKVAAGDSVRVTPRLGSDEDHLVLIDGQGRTYSILPYFEGDPVGGVDVIVVDSRQMGLFGFAVDRTAHSDGGKSTEQKPQ